jgi:hypothetical protein
VNGNNKKCVDGIKTRSVSKPWIQYTNIPLISPYLRQRAVDLPSQTPTEPWASGLVLVCAHAHAHHVHHHAHHVHHHDTVPCSQTCTDEEKILSGMRRPQRATRRSTYSSHHNEVHSNLKNALSFLAATSRTAMNSPTPRVLRPQIRTIYANPRKKLPRGARDAGARAKRFPLPYPESTTI